MKRILIVSYYWPPTGGSGVQRWVKFAKYLPSLGWQPVVYTPENPEQLVRDESLAAEIGPEVEVIRTHIDEPYELYRKLSGGKKGSEVNPVNHQKKSWKQKLSVLLRGNLFIPDPRIGWVRPSVKYLTKYLEEHPVDVMVTTGPPHSMHLIGRGVKKATGVRWIADFRDPWTQMFYFKHLGLLPFARRKHLRLEKSVLDAADAVIAVSPPVRDDFQARTSTPVHLVTNGFDPSDFDFADEAPDGFFNLVHTGLFASDGNPLELWKVLAAKCAADDAFKAKLRIRLAGKVDREIVQALEDAGLGDNLVQLGYLPHKETVREQRGAAVLMLPLRQEPEYAKVLPGKIFEYLAARRPVLGIGQADGAAATILRDTGAGEMYDWDSVQPVAAFMDEAWTRFQDGSFAALDSDIQAYSRPALTESLVSLL